MSIGNLIKKETTSIPSGSSTVNSYLQKAEDNNGIEFNLDLTVLTLEELKEQYIEIDRQSHILKGKILLEARKRFKSNQEFGKWRSLNFSGLPQQTANNLMSLASYFDEENKPLAHIPVSAGYLISAKINEPIAELVYQMVIERENPTVQEVRNIINELKNGNSNNQQTDELTKVATVNVIDKIMAMIEKLAENEKADLFEKIRKHYPDALNAQSPE
jgi:cell division protein ZapA (FtsZ GTPase activity inhibitor)